MTSNEASLLDPLTDPAAGKYRAQWNDDFHHVWHVLLTGQKDGYYGDYAAEPLRDIARVLKSGFVYQGETIPTAAAPSAANRAAICRRRLSSRFCKITTRSEIGPSANGSMR